MICIVMSCRVMRTLEMPEPAGPFIDAFGRAVTYLVSQDGDYITGAELSINGGLLM